MCLRFQFCTHQRVCILHFLKKANSLYPSVHSSLDAGKKTVKKTVHVAVYQETFRVIGGFLFLGQI
jgi:hypothetical protein